MIATQTFTQEATRILSYTKPIEEVSLLDFLRAYPDETRLYVENGRTSVAIAGVGSVVTLTASGENRFASIRKQSAELFEQLQTVSDYSEAPAPQLMGGAAFDPDFEAHDLWAGFASATFVLPRISIARIKGQYWLTVNATLEADKSRDDLLAGLEATAKSLQQSIHSVPQDLNGHSHLDSAKDSLSIPLKPLKDWRSMLEAAIACIHAGEVGKVVLSRALKFIAKDAIDPLAVLDILDNQYPDCYRFLMEFEPGNAFFGATPELLASVSSGQMRTMALAGSAPRGDNSMEDDNYGRELLDNAKEQQEHNFVIRQIKNNLDTITSTLEISPEPNLMRLRNIQHIRTDITGGLKSDHNVLNVVEALHPTPAVGGNPRPKALEMITELEPQSRGWYAAPIGWTDANGDGEFVVGLRSGVSKDNEALLYSGAGILGASDPEREWDETERKFRPMLNALQRSHSHEGR